jgi:hypothetical protein
MQAGSSRRKIEPEMEMKPQAIQSNMCSLWIASLRFARNDELEVSL